ncbi:DUF4377 domain-containing protein [Psychrobacter sp. AOP22-C1-22]|uniref:DUF4377 domain-containing protein n=1 Tax=unclassified Psychrobacter TaxID=196806 RepID=UPI001787E939|nr:MULTISPECIES: DUF4377 domain-containing protein [unclassified Psychrobacter]MDN5800905.1 DUF4377 domain-containing protein [Psychrobacter sp.]MBE0405381.1 DUF4377 domain-containing protein [Psychrobacter sp. FME6]MBE0443695.1 DUF4377 domain-containing protein [Psychrobacter sp. FME5]MDN5891966.1 DUF4377 domain-containing protein [Psychrobacter sp.]MDN5897903.1 DUF4377 domain-containing protein [Psychrobacter sp.]
MSFIRLCTLALLASSSLAACSSHEQTNMDNKTSVSQVKDSNSFIHSIKPSRSEAIIGQVTGVISQDRAQQKVILMTKNGQPYTASISRSNFGQQNAYQMQELAVGDYIEVMGEQSTSQSDNKRQIIVRAMPYVLRKIMVADHQVDCVGVAPQLCLLIKPAKQANSQSDWEYRYSAIEGFDYEPDYEYTLLIKNTPISNPPADASSIHSKLIKVLEKKRTKN